MLKVFFSDATNNRKKEAMADDGTDIPGVCKINISLRFISSALIDFHIIETKNTLVIVKTHKSIYILTFKAP